MITLLIKHSLSTFVNFREWMVKEVYNGNIRGFDKFIKLPASYQCISLISYLEKVHKVPILAALMFYSKVRYRDNYADLLRNTIRYEFIRIENKKETTYDIF